MRASKAEQLASTELKNTGRIASETIRTSLRESTKASHDLLDELMRQAGGWRTRGDYIQFLILQYAARSPIETWLRRNAPEHLCPPEQCGLIADDLGAMGREPIPLETYTALPLHDLEKASAYDKDWFVLGVVWTLAGSSLGNRAIFKEIEKVSNECGEEIWPHSFLEDEDMLAFWKRLRLQVERPASQAQTAKAARASNAVFDHFIQSTRANLRPTKGSQSGQPALPLSTPSCPVVGR